MHDSIVHRACRLAGLLIICLALAACARSTAPAGESAAAPTAGATAAPTAIATAAAPTPTVNKTAARVPILMYHHIAPQTARDERSKQLVVPPPDFEAQLAYFQRSGYSSITLDAIAAALDHGAPLPARPLILTFDDGYDDFYTNAYPLLQRYQIKATIFIIVGRVGETGYMSWAQLRELAASPLITVGSHTRTHPQLAEKSDERVRDELAGSKADLEQQLQISVRHLAYPSGSYNKHTIELAREAGYQTAVTVHDGVSERADKQLQMPRVYMKGTKSFDQLIALIERKD